MDVSVWLPLASPDHEHHERARRYWDQESAERIAFCRVTAMAFTRHLTNSRVMQHAVLNSRRAWQEYERWLSLPEVEFLNEPESLHDRYRRFATTLELGQASWTDAYLAGFSIGAGCRLITFDCGFERYKGLDLVILRVDGATQGTLATPAAPQSLI